MVLLPQTDAQGAAHVASRMLALMREPVMLSTGQEINLTGSIGIAIYPDNGHDLDRLSQCADAALLQAKQDGRNNFKFFTEQMHERAREALLLENQLRRALTNGELLLHYQPQVDAVSSRIMGAEALIRWQHPQRGLVSPLRFIPVAESSGQILQIGEWVLRSAMQQVADWQAAGLAVVPVAVNLSALQFRQATLCDTVSEALSASGVSPALLELELTESIAMEDSSFTLDQISRLHAMGITLSIDDFGTGYSSLSYLKRYQIDKLKIDQSFVRDLDNGADDGSLVRAIINMAHGMGFKTIAEGVETQAQLDCLRADGCDEIQGYFFSRPVPAEAFAQLLRQPTLSAAVLGDSK
jgi:EAL domain-containing protein (putative c-di-GMP-specific phosphodiesterase class I)